MNLLFDALQYYIIASAIGASLVLVAGWLWQQRTHPRHPQPVYGPFRPNVRKIL